MASPTLAIELDPGPWDGTEWAEYRPCGGTISGRVRIECDEPVNCRRLLLTVGWHTEGRGDRDAENPVEQTLHTGELSPGSQDFPFTATLPEVGPISYAGHYINIIWAVQARLDLAWRIDPKTERVFYVALP